MSEINATALHKLQDENEALKSAWNAALEVVGIKQSGDLETDLLRMKDWMSICDEAKREIDDLRPLTELQDENERLKKRLALLAEQFNSLGGAFHRLDKYGYINAYEPEEQGQCDHWRDIARMAIKHWREEFEVIK